jgi:hypothetical protein
MIPDEDDSYSLEQVINQTHMKQTELRIKKDQFNP